MRDFEWLRCGNAVPSMNSPSTINYAIDRLINEVKKCDIKIRDCSLLNYRSYHK